MIRCAVGASFILGFGHRLAQSFVTLDLIENPLRRRLNVLQPERTFASRDIHLPVCVIGQRMAHALEIVDAPVMKRRILLLHDGTEVGDAFVIRAIRVPLIYRTTVVAATVVTLILSECYGLGAIRPAVDLILMTIEPSPSICCYQIHRLLSHG